MLIVVSGLPATGKTTLADSLARRVGAVHLSVDIVEDALLRAGAEPGWTTGVAAYAAVGAMARQNLVLERDVVVDAVNDSDAARQTWRDAAHTAGVELRFVFLVPPERSEHQRRLRERRRGLTHIPEPTWAQVVARAETYEPWSDGHVAPGASAEPLELPAGEPIEQLVTRLTALLALQRVD